MSATETRMPQERVVFAQSVDALWRSCGPNPGAEILQAFEESGFAVTGKLSVAYPAHQFAMLLARLGEARFPAASPEERYLLLGRAFMEGYQHTTMGRALLRLIAVLGPRRVLLQTTRSFRSANNYSSAEVKELEPCHFQMVVFPVNHPGWHRGIVITGLQMAGAKNVRMDLSSHRGEQAVFDIRWE